MRVWIVDDAGYPSGFAGGRFSSMAPNLRMQALEVAQQIPVAGGTTLHQSLAPDVVSAAAVDAEGHAVPLPLHGNQLDWTAPAGQWTVLTVDHEFRTSPTRSDTNPHRVKDTSQSLEDYLNPAATAQYLAWTHEQYKHYVGDEFGKTIMGFRGDEPDFSISGLPWTPAFFVRFRELKGYDVQPYAALFAQTPSRRNPGVHHSPHARAVAHQGRLLRCLLTDVRRRILQAAGRLVCGQQSRIPGPPQSRRDGDGADAQRRFVLPRHALRRSARHRRHLAPDLDRHHRRFPATRQLRLSRLRQATRLHRKLRRIPPRARRHDGAVHPERTIRARRQPGRDDVLPRNLVRTETSALVYGRTGLLRFNRLRAAHELPHVDGTARRNRGALSCRRAPCGSATTPPTRSLSRPNGC